MGFLRRPTTGGIVEGGRLGRPYGPGAHSCALRDLTVTPAFFLSEELLKASMELRCNYRMTTMLAVTGIPPLDPCLLATILVLALNLYGLPDLRH
jgi:hypothetical protein